MTRILQLATVVSCVVGLWIILFQQVDRGTPAPTRTTKLGLIYWTPDAHLTDNVRSQQSSPETLTTEESSGIVARGIHRTIENSDYIQVQVPWNPSRNPAPSQTASWLSGLSKATERELIVAIDWMNNERKGLRGPSDWSFTDAEHAALFTADMVKVAEEHSPNILLLGVEVDFLARLDPAEFAAFVNLYEQTYAAIKEVAPTIKLTVSFQYEHIRPLTMGDNEKMLGSFGELLDLYGLSTYPCLIAKGTNELNTDYYAELNSLNKPVGIFETSWPTSDPTSPEVKNYINWLFGAVKDTPIDLIIWSSTTDLLRQNEDEFDVGSAGCNADMTQWSPFMGLWTLDGSPKNGTEEWSKNFRNRHVQAFNPKSGEATLDLRDPRSRPLY